MPVNILTWTAMLIISIVLFIRAVLRGTLVFSKAIVTGTGAALLLSLPLLWTPSVWYVNAVPRLLGIWGALIFSLALQQVSLSLPMKRHLLLLVMVMAVLESLLSLFQWGWPELARQVMEYNVSVMGNRPYGIFQQPNLLASFVATGYGVAVYFSYLRGSRWCQAALWCCQGLMLFVLCLTQSRVGLYGAMLVLFLLSTMAVASCPAPGRPRYSAAVRYAIIVLLFCCAVILNIAGAKLPDLSLVVALSLVLLLSGMIWCCFLSWHTREGVWRQVGNFTVVLLCAAFFLLFRDAMLGNPVSTLADGSPAALDLLHAGSSLERLNILRGTLFLIRQHPLLGVGLGGFEAAFAGVREMLGLHIGGYTITYPHNEILYVLAEGGVVALAGLILALAACLWPILKPAPPEERAAIQRYFWPVFVLSIPVLLHTCLEYPFYQSALHFLVLLLLVRIAQPDNSGNEQCAGWGKRPGVRLGMAALVVCLLVTTLFLVNGLIMQAQLTWTERAGLPVMPPATSPLATLTQYERYDFDAHTRLLLDYNVSHNTGNLDAYFIWGLRYSQVHNDASVYDSLIRIARFEGWKNQVQALSLQARETFASDSRFALPAGSLGDGK